MARRLIRMMVLVDRSFDVPHFDAELKVHALTLEKEINGKIYCLVLIMACEIQAAQNA